MDDKYAKKFIPSVNTFFFCNRGVRISVSYQEGENESRMLINAGVS